MNYQTGVQIGPRNPAGHSPLRRPGSIRRTQSIDTCWPDGFGKAMRMNGQARDLVTAGDGSDAFVVAEARFNILASPAREILEISCEPYRSRVEDLVGMMGGGKMRKAVGELLPEEREAHSPLFMLLDDFTGASMVAFWAWSRWVDDINAFRAEKNVPTVTGKAGQMTGVCAGFAPGSTAMNPDGTSLSAKTPAPRLVSLVHPDDPQGWHTLPEQEGVGMRRARRIDVWRENGRIQINVGFQDSATDPVGCRVAIHEYVIEAVADAETFELLSLEVDPRVLPYQECRAAAPKAKRVLGTRLTDLNLSVRDSLHKTDGCTHLNDMLRYVAYVPQLTRAGRL